MCCVIGGCVQISVCTECVHMGVLECAGKMFLCYRVGPTRTR